MYSYSALVHYFGVDNYFQNNIYMDLKHINYPSIDVLHIHVYIVLEIIVNTKIMPCVNNNYSPSVIHNLCMHIETTIKSSPEETKESKR